MELIPCPACDTVNPADARICRKCRKPLSVIDSEAIPDGPPAAGRPPERSSPTRPAPSAPSRPVGRPTYPPRPSRSVSPAARRGAPSPVYATARSRSHDDYDAMRIGGFMMMAFAVWQLIEHHVLSYWIEIEISTTRAVAQAALPALLGVAMLQGSETARKIVLVLTTLVGLLLGLFLVILYLVGFWTIWPLVTATLCSCVGVVILVLRSRIRLHLLVSGLALVATGWIGSVISAVILIGSHDIGTMKLITDWSTSERSYEEPGQDLGLRVPPQWVILKRGNPIDEQNKALVTLANTEIVCFAQIFVERTAGWFAGLDQYLTSLVQTYSKERTDMQEIERSDGSVDGTPTRRVKLRWREDDVTLYGQLSTWRDGDVFYHIYLIGPNVVAKKLEAEYLRLEKNVSFAAPWSAFLEERAERIYADCPILSEKSILKVARVVSREAPSEAFFREGYRLALQGLPLLDPQSSERLRASVKQLFDAIPASHIGSFGRYVERLRDRQPTSPQQDREMAQVVRLAMQRLPSIIRENLRDDFAMAIDLGQFDRTQRRMR